MKQSVFALKTLRETPKDADSKNAGFLERGGYVQKVMAGVYSYLPLGLRVIKKIEQIVREEMDRTGSQELLLPVLGPKENWQTTGRWDSLDVLYKLKTADDKEVALNPTHEEIIVPLAKSMINSYKDLPLSLYQIQDKFRNEKRAKSGLLRGREFLMKDMYSYHLTEADLDKYYKEMTGAYKKVFERVGLGDSTVLTAASGGSFSKYSHEFQTLAENGEDTIYLCEKCRVAVNKEIIEEHRFCPECKGKELTEKKAIEVGNIFKLMTKYSEPFGLKVNDKNGEEKTVIMGCYGLGISRLFGAIVEVIGTEKKISWPEEIAPFQKHIISLGKNEEAEKLYSELKKNSEVLFDDRDTSAGEKFADADLIGAPVRIIISEKSLAAGGAEVVEGAHEAKIIPLRDIS
jgi:prolyl-tRNA synthetase